MLYVYLPKKSINYTEIDRKKRQTDRKIDSLGEERKRERVCCKVHK